MYYLEMDQLPVNGGEQSGTDSEQPATSGGQPGTGSGRTDTSSQTGNLIFKF
jgi:hypothetical protein